MTSIVALETKLLSESADEQNMESFSLVVHVAQSDSQKTSTAELVFFLWATTTDRTQSMTARRLVGREIDRVIVPASDDGENEKSEYVRSHQTNVQNRPLSQTRKRCVTADPHGYDHECFRSEFNSRIISKSTTRMFTFEINEP